MADYLLVAPDAARLALSFGVPPEVVVPAADLTAARAHLSGRAFETVFVDRDFADWSNDLADLADGLGRTCAIEEVDVSSPEFSSRLVSISNDGAPGRTEAATLARAPNEGVGDALADATALLHSLRNDMSHVVHALNNPLAVISGNAQLGREIAHSLQADDSLVDAFREIDEAAEKLRALFSEVTRLRQRVDDAIDG